MICGGGKLGVVMVAPKTWEKWIDVLEEVLEEADVGGGASAFAIHIDSALIEARKALDLKETMPRHDYLSSDDKIS
jgi:hypothetical protein